MKTCGLRKESTVAELKMSVLESVSQLVPQFVRLSPYPAISFDFNFIVGEEIRWADLQASVEQSAGDCLEIVNYKDTYRDTKRDGAGKKRLFLSVEIRSADHTLTGDEAEKIHKSIIAACERDHGAKLVA